MGGGGVGAAVAHDGAATLAAIVPVRAATSRGRRGAGLTSCDFLLFFIYLIIAFYWTELCLSQSNEKLQ